MLYCILEYPQFLTLETAACLILLDEMRFLK